MNLDLFKRFFKSSDNVTGQTSQKLMSEFSNSTNPYLHAKWEWNERYGSFIQEKKKWQMISFGLMGALFVCLVGLVCLSLQSRIVPYIVKTDEMGKPIIIEKIDPTTKLNSAVVSYQIAEFMTHVRTVTTDGKLKKSWMTQAQKICSEFAWNTLSDYWQKNPPNKIAQMMNISIKINSILPIKSSDSWQVNWTETAVKNGETIGSTQWTAIVNVGVHAVTNENEFMQNPTGLFVKSINWSRVE